MKEKKKSGMREMMRKKIYEINFDSVLIYWDFSGTIRITKSLVF